MNIVKNGLYVPVGTIAQHEYDGLYVPVGTIAQHEYDGL